MFGLGTVDWAVRQSQLSALLLPPWQLRFFYYLLKAPTLVGRALMDRVEGFRRRLSIATACRRLRVLTTCLPMFSALCFCVLESRPLAQKFPRRWRRRNRRRATQRRKLFTVVVFGAAFASFSASGFASNFGSSFSSARPPLPHRPRVPVAAVRPAARWRGGGGW